jgi:hypothetical protein
VKPPQDQALIDIDAILREKFGADDDQPAIATVPIKILDEEFKVQKDLNAFNLLQLGNLEDTSVIIKMMVNAVVPDERPRFKSTLGGASGLTAEKLLAIFQAMVEAASTTPGGSPRPTDSSSASKAGTPKRGAKQLSAVASSSTESTPTD